MPMEQCPQCGAERVVGDNFCDNCGHRYASDAEPPQQAPPQQPAPPPPSFQAARSGKLAIRDASGSEVIRIQFDDAPKTIGRQDVANMLISDGKDPLQVSRKQCTVFKEGDDYYIEDEVTAVQDKPSGNHTTVNGRDITGQGKVKLADNDRVVLAMLVNATFRIE